MSSSTRSARTSSPRPTASPRGWATGATTSRAAVSNLQADATAGEQGKVCANDLAAALVTRLGGKKGCEAAIKSQLAQVDSLEAGVESVAVAAGGKTATAQVKSIREGKSRPSTVALVAEGGKWKISGLG
jgi:hypothetical protein